MKYDLLYIQSCMLHAESPRLALESEADVTESADYGEAVPEVRELRILRRGSQAQLRTASIDCLRKNSSIILPIPCSLLSPYIVGQLVVVVVV